MANKKKHEANGTNGTHAAAPDTQPAPAPEGVPAGAVEKKRYTESLPCRLDDAALNDLRAKLTGITCERVEQEQQIALLRETVKGLKKCEESLVAQVQSGTEEKPVEVVEYLLPDFSVQAVRTDTGEVVEVRQADADDLQEELPGTEREGDEGGAEISEDRP